MIDPDLDPEPRPAPREAPIAAAVQPADEMLYELETGPEPVEEPAVPEPPAPDHIEVVEVLSPSRRHLARAGRR